MNWIWIFALIVITSAPVIQKEDDSSIIVRSFKDAGYYESLEECMAAARVLTFKLRSRNNSAVACARRLNV